MFKRYKGLSHTVFFIILVLLASCKPVYHLAKVENQVNLFNPEPLIRRWIKALHLTEIS